MFIVMAKRIFDDTIIHNSISINELQPYPMNNLRIQKSEENKQFWRTNIESQLESIYSAIKDAAHYHTKTEILLVDRDSPSDWNLINFFFQYAHQTYESFLEQSIALKINVQTIRKYMEIKGEYSTIYTKNIITYGAPGTGKSFIGQVIVLYCLKSGIEYYNYINSFNGCAY